jgi:hypothetical protein
MKSKIASSASLAGLKSAARALGENTNQAQPVRTRWAAQERIQMNGNIRNEAESELVQRVWKEQFDNARRFVSDGLKRRRERDAHMAQGINLMVLSLKDQLSALVPAPVKTRLESDYGAFLNLLNQF